MHSIQSVLAERPARVVFSTTPPILGQSRAMESVRGQIKKVANTCASVLLTGETGTGKELVAKALHAQSRPDARYMALNCGGMTGEILESTLFGHVPGAFTGAKDRRIGAFEAADKGTLFLDEIGEIPLSDQAVFLRVLQERKLTPVGCNREIPIDVRVISATNQNFQELVAAGKFRRDLYFRLRVVEIQLPSLREHKEDIPELAEYFVRQYCDLHGKKVCKLSYDSQKALVAYDWPGNVRELSNLIERAVLFAEDTCIQVADLAFESWDSPESTGKTQTLEVPMGGIQLKQAEKQLLLSAIKRTGFRQDLAAKLLGISPRVIFYKLDKYGIDVDKLREECLNAVNIQ